MQTYHNIESKYLTRLTMTLIKKELFWFCEIYNIILSNILFVDATKDEISKNVHLLDGDTPNSVKTREFTGKSSIPPQATIYGVSIVEARDRNNIHNNNNNNNGHETTQSLDVEFSTFMTINPNVIYTITFYIDVNSENSDTNGGVGGNSANNIGDSEVTMASASTNENEAETTSRNDERTVGGEESVDDASEASQTNSASNNGQRNGNNEEKEEKSSDKNSREKPSIPDNSEGGSNEGGSNEDSSPNENENSGQNTQFDNDNNPREQSDDDDDDDADADNTQTPHEASRLRNIQLVSAQCAATIASNDPTAWMKILGKLDNKNGYTIETFRSNPK